MTGNAGRAAFEPRRVGFAALTAVLGIQSLKTLLPLLAFIFHDRLDWHSAAIGLLIAVVFVTGFLAAPLRRLLGGRRFLLLAAAGLGLLRLGLQLWTGDPLVDFALALAATVLFFLVLPALVAERAPGASPSLALGWMIGLALETALHVAYGTWDMSWRSDAGTLGLVFLLVLAQGRLLVELSQGERAAAADAPRPVAWAWIGAGCFLFLDLIVAGNVARLAALTGWAPGLAASLAVGGRLLAVAATALAVARPPSWRTASAAAAALVGSLAIPWPTGLLAAALWLVSTILAAALLATIFLAIGASPPAGGLARLGAAHGMGLLVLAVLFFLYYGAVDLRLGVAKEALPILAALGLGLAAAGAAGAAPRIPARQVGRRWLAAGVLFAAPLVDLGTAPRLRPGEVAGFPLRVMTYNLHCGIDPRGHLGLEAIAAAIEAEEPEVVALQEVSRGWVIAGAADTAVWLSRRLGMPFVFGPTADPLWGNAILSRRPISRHESFELPSEGLLLRRGALAARIDLGADGHVEAIATHFHHLPGEGAVRQRQSRALLDFWGQRRRSVILGDLNGRPGEPEIELLRAAGLGDVLDLAGVDPGHTHSSLAPVKRIDYIWISPDLVARDASVPRAAASDHLPVVATLERRPTSAGEGRESIEKEGFLNPDCKTGGL